MRGILIHLSSKQIEVPQALDGQEVPTLLGTGTFLPIHVVAG